MRQDIRVKQREGSPELYKGDCVELRFSRGRMHSKKGNKKRKKKGANNPTNHFG